MSDGEEPDVDAGTKGTNDDWQNITKPGPHDVLCGRGGGTNNHSGNVKFRQMINEHKLRYLAASKVEKPKVAREVVKLWRGLEPSGRFLARKDDSRKGPGSVKAEGNVWYDVGDKKAREKASQCLRERTPDVLPYVREMQRQQDLLTGQGLRLVEQQMRLRNESAMAAKNGYPAPVQTISESEVANAFSVEHFFTHGFNTMPPQQQAAAAAAISAGQFPPGMTMPPGMSPNDAIALQQMVDPAQWAQLQQQQQQQQQAYPTQAPTSYTGNDLEPVPLPNAYAQGGVVHPGGATTRMPPDAMPDPVLSGDPSDPSAGEDDPDELTLEEYMESMKEYKEFLEPPKEDRTKVLESMQENSWVKSFHSIETSTKEEDDSIAGGGSTIAPSKKKKSKNKTLDAALRTGKLGHLGQSTRSALSSRSGLSGISAMSEKSKRSTQSGLSHMSGVSMFSSMTDDSRSTKMSGARGLTSNLSLMSDITDLSETLNNMDLATAAAETTASGAS